jgi:hypothetical protein
MKKLTNNPDAFNSKSLRSESLRRAVPYIGGFAVAGVVFAVGNGIINNYQETKEPVTDYYASAIAPPALVEPKSPRASSSLDAKDIVKAIDRTPESKITVAEQSEITSLNIEGSGNVDFEIVTPETSDNYIDLEPPTWDEAYFIFDTEVPFDDGKNVRYFSGNIGINKDGKLVNEDGEESLIAVSVHTKSQDLDWRPNKILKTKIGDKIVINTSGYEFVFEVTNIQNYKKVGSKSAWEGIEDLFKDSDMFMAGCQVGKDSNGDPVPTEEIRAIGAKLIAAESLDR